MPMPKAQLKAFLAELNRLGEKAVSKNLNELLFRPSNDEVSVLHPELQPQPQMPPEGQQQDPAAMDQAGPVTNGGT